MLICTLYVKFSVQLYAHHVFSSVKIARRPEFYNHRKQETKKYIEVYDQYY